MKSTQRLPGWLAGIALLIPISASAWPLTYNFSGVLTANTFETADQLPAALIPGAAYNATVSFETSDFTRSNPGNLANADYFGSSGTGLSFSFDLDCDTDPGTQPCATDPGSSPSRIQMLNNLTLQDGLVHDLMIFTRYEGGIDDGVPSFRRWQAIFIGSEFVWDSAPANLPPSANAQVFQTHSLQVCPLNVVSMPGPNQNPPPACGSEWLVQGFDAVQSVPAPATLTLLGMGIAGLGIARRRKRST